MRRRPEQKISLQEQIDLNSPSLPSAPDAADTVVVVVDIDGTVVVVVDDTVVGTDVDCTDCSLDDDIDSSVSDVYFASGAVAVNPDEYFPSVWLNLPVPHGCYQSLQMTDQNYTCWTYFLCLETGTLTAG